MRTIHSSVEERRTAARARIPAVLALGVAAGLSIVAAVTLPGVLRGEQETEFVPPQPDIPMEVVEVEPRGSVSDVVMRQCVAAPETTPVEIVCSEFAVQLDTGSVQVGDTVVTQAV